MPDGVNEPGWSRPKLVLHVEGAREDELERGRLAAESVLHRDGEVDPFVAMAANGLRDFIMFDADGEAVNDLTREQHQLAQLWEDALWAGIDACCAGWEEQPVDDFWLGIDTGIETIRPWYMGLPIATFKLRDE
ncbi:MAG TPA: hypothetical protein VGI94_24730 [Reyranella sp.]